MSYGIDELLKSWERQIDEAEKAANEAAKAEVNLDSTLAHEIKAIAQTEGKTLAEKVAKGSEMVTEAKLKYLEEQNKVKAANAKIKWIEAAYTWERVKYSQEGKATR